MPELVFYRRGEEVLRFALGEERVVLGRGEKSDVVIPDPEVSRLQVALVYDGTGYRVEDLSGKGTRVSGRVVEQEPLADGTDIQLGQWRALFRQRPLADAAGLPGADEATAAGAGTQVQPAPSTPASWQPVQVRVRRGHQEAVHRLSADGFTVGKDPSCDLVLDDRFVSSRHLRVTRREGGFHLVDAGSTNGTWVAGARVFEAEVPLHTTLRLGETELVLEPAAAPGRKEAPPFHGIIGTDPLVRQLADMIQRVAPSSATVTILGESGTGKELVARAVHAASPRAERGAFIPVNCAAISKELIESELFGHEKGAFTGAQGTRKGAFEEADGGTIFLDEIGELPLDMQAKLLRALESGEVKRVGASRPMTVDARVVCATNRDLLAQVREGKFREDLYYRLCVIPLHLPPLRSRRGDLVALAEHFLRAFAPRHQSVGFTPAALERLSHHRWPGNIRELRNVVHRALLLRKGPLIDAGDLTFDTEHAADTGAPTQELIPGLTLEQMLARVERQLVEAALRRFHNNRERVARELGVARSTLFKKLKDWGLTRQDERED
jgi:DNA-binding NtrC family response regulator